MNNWRDLNNKGGAIAHSLELRVQCQAPGQLMSYVDNLTQLSTVMVVLLMICTHAVIDLWQA